MAYPFKLLDSYTLEDKDSFFGRDEETEALYTLLQQTNLMVLYGASGTGKSSLIQCGLGNRFMPHEWYPLFVRRDEHFTQSLLRGITQAAGPEPEEEEWALDFAEAEETPAEAPTQPQDAARAESPTEAAFMRLYKRYFKPIYLILDQFEELFILGTAEEAQATLKALEALQALDIPLKIIISTREEYLGHLYHWATTLPTLLHARQRIEPMTLPKVQAVVQGITQQEGGLISLNPEELAPFTHTVFEQLKPRPTSPTIALPYLQLFLDRLYLQITQDDARQQPATFTLAALQQLGSLDDVLRDFLQEQVQHVLQNPPLEAPTLQNEDQLWPLLLAFVTLEGTKEPRTLPQLQEALAKQNIRWAEGQYKALLEAFVKRRILRYREEEAWYEVAHDTLAAQMAEHRSEADIARLEVERLIAAQANLAPEAQQLFNERQLNFVEPYLNKLSLGRAEQEFLNRSRKAVANQRRRRTRRRQVIFGSLTLALAIMTGLSIWALGQQSLAKRKTREANASLAKANTLINALYFYDNTFALSVKEIGFFQNNYGWVTQKRYGYINNEGQEVIPYIYDFALPFDQSGFAKVARDGTPYLLDTAGNTYPVAYSLAELNDNTTALDLREDKALQEFPLEILQHPQLQVLLFSGARGNWRNFGPLPQEFAQLTQLKVVQMDYCGITSLPEGIGRLQQLQVLKAENNQLTRLPKGIEQLGRLHSLYAASNQLTALPQGITQLAGLKKLDLDNNLLTALPAGIGQLRQLQRLALRNNNLSALPEGIGQLSQLQMLGIGGNSLAALPEWIGQLSQLVELDVSNNKLSTLPKWIGNLALLQRLYLNGNTLTTLPESIGQLHQLEELTLNRNKLTELPEIIAELKGLKILSATSNTLSALPEWIGQLGQLRYFHAEKNKIETLPESVGKLSQLEELKLSNNKLTQLPESLGHLGQLKRLWVVGNSFDTLPECIRQLSQLEELRASKNPLTSLPEWIGQLSKLQGLYVERSPLQAIPESIGQMTRLETLWLRHNKITHLPDTLRNMGKLGQLMVGNNPLDTLPEWIGQLSELKRLDIEKVSPKALPEWLFRLGQLQDLRISGNQLTALPENMGQLSRLRILRASNNQLSTLPASMGQLPLLKELRIDNNKFNTLPPYISQQKQLQLLHVQKNTIAKQEIEALRQALPKCKIKF